MSFNDGLLNEWTTGRCENILFMRLDNLTGDISHTVQRLPEKVVMIFTDILTIRLLSLVRGHLELLWAVD